MDEASVLTETSGRCSYIFNLQTQPMHWELPGAVLRINDPEFDGFESHTVHYLRGRGFSVDATSRAGSTPAPLTTSARVAQLAEQLEAQRLLKVGGSTPPPRTTFCTRSSAARHGRARHFRSEGVGSNPAVCTVFFLGEELPGAVRETNDLVVGRFKSCLPRSLNK